MTIEELLCYAKKYIHKTQAEMLLASLIGVNSLELLLMLDKIIDDDIAKQYKEKVLMIKDNIPIQYVIGNVNFYGMTYIVNKNVLIPRFETEELVENTIMYINKYFSLPLDIIDLGCGSGAIGLTIKAKLGNVNVDLVDISESALEVAKENGKIHQLKANYLLSDMWNNIEKKYDVIISNPPYIRNDEEIEDIVKNNEPSIALYGGLDGLDCYRKIRKDLLNHVKDKFLLAMEIGDLQREDVTKMFSDIPDVKIFSKKDLSGRDRMIFVLKI